MNPLKAFLDIRKEELRFALLMFGYFFLVITSFWILKPVKKSQFIRHYDEPGFHLVSWHMQAAQAELLAKILNMLVAALAVWAFTLLARRLERQQLTLLFSGFFVAGYLWYAYRLAEPSDLTVWTFYLFGDLYSTLMVATFFAFLNDSVSPEAARRLYGPIGLGGVAGGVFGTSVVATAVKRLSGPDWMVVLIGIALAIAVLAFAAGRAVARHRPPRSAAPAPAPPDPEPGTLAALEGARLVLRSPYLLAIVAIVGLYEIVSTIMDYQFTSSVQHYLDGPAIGTHFARVFLITNVVSLSVQVFLTSFVMTRFGLTAALLVLPAAVLLGSTAFLALPVLWTGSLLNTADNGFSYSINQSAKEALYVPASRDEKYKAKAFIDMFLQRFAKSLAVLLSLAVTALFREFSATRWLSLFTLVLLVVWTGAAVYAGRSFARVTGHRAAPGER